MRKNEKRRVQRGKTQKENIIVKDLDILLVKCAELVDGIKKRITPIAIALAFIFSVANIFKEKKSEETKPPVVVVVCYHENDSTVDKTNEEGVATSDDEDEGSLTKTEDHRPHADTVIHIDKDNLEVATL